jgi:hypothetical protein
MPAQDQAGAVHSAKENEVAVQPSGPKGDNPGTAGPGPTGVRSETPENAKGHLNPSAPEDSNTTPGSTGEK